MRALPGPLCKSIRGASMKSFHPLSSSSGEVRSAASRRPASARKAVRRGPRNFVGTAWAVKARRRTSFSSETASNAARPTWKPASARATRRCAPFCREGWLGCGASAAFSCNAAGACAGSAPAAAALPPRCAVARTGGDCGNGPLRAFILWRSVRLSAGRDRGVLG